MLVDIFDPIVKVMLTRKAWKTTVRTSSCSYFKGALWTVSPCIYLVCGDFLTDIHYNTKINIPNISGTCLYLLVWFVLCKTNNNILLNNFCLVSVIRQYFYSYSSATFRKLLLKVWGYFQLSNELEHICQIQVNKGLHSR